MLIEILHLCVGVEVRWLGVGTLHVDISAVDIPVWWIQQQLLLCVCIAACGLAGQEFAEY